mmetsp:Transcript_44315/g.130713  ORF Transcript_44315/g.130713 Transcript_44315/m.130713 type:complete len:217 (-) Transcript_44315:614-1264(-)
MLFFSCACMRIALARKSAFCSCFIQFHVLLPVSFITSGHRRIPARVILHCVHRFPFMQLLCTTLIIAFHLPPSRVRAFVPVPLQLVPSGSIPAGPFQRMISLASFASPHLATIVALFIALRSTSRACVRLSCPRCGSFLPVSSQPTLPNPLASFILLFHALFLSFCFLLHIWSALSHSSLASLHAAALYHAHTRASTLRSVLSNNGVLLDVNARAA